MQDVYNYIKQVKNGEIISCSQLKQAVQRFENDQKNPLFYFNTDKVQHVFNFFSCLQHTKDRHAGKYFDLLPWEKFFICQIFGWYWKTSNTRRFTDIFLSVSKKNGKTALIVGTLLYITIFEGTGNLSVVASNSREQASDVIFKAITNFCINLDSEEENISRKHNTIEYRNNVLKCISNESKSKAGLGPLAVYLDEFFEFRNWDMYQNLQTAQSDLINKFFFVSSTAGFNKQLPFYELYHTGEEILAGLKKSENTLVLIYTLDPEDNFRNEDVWIKSNPSLNFLIPVENLRKAVQSVDNNKSLETQIKTWNFNTWCDVLKTWIPDSYILNASKNLSFDYYQGMDCILGIDLSSVSDLTSITFQFEIDGNFHYINKYYLPLTNINSRIDQTTYQNWHKQGYITLQAGNHVDYPTIIEDIEKIRKENKLNITNIGYDDHFASQFIAELKSRGYRCTHVPQAIDKFTAGTLEFERLMLASQIILDNNKITRWCFANSELRHNSTGCVKPDKALSKDKIDGVISILTALNCWLSMPKYSNRIF
jgi:phage terminase large subunit-like protein